MKFARNLTLLFAIAALAAGLLMSQTDGQTHKGTVQRIKVHGKALEGGYGACFQNLSCCFPPKVQFGSRH